MMRYRAQIASPRVDVAEDVAVCRLQVGEVKVAGNETSFELRYADSAECRLAFRKRGPSRKSRRFRSTLVPG